MKKLISLTAFALATATVMTGCATVAPRYVPTDKYQNYDCNYLGAEYNRLNQYIVTTPRANPFTSSGVGLGLGIGRGGLFPSLNFGVGTGTVNNSNVSNAMGEQDAVVQAGRYKQCGFAMGKKLYSEK